MGEAKNIYFTCLKLLKFFSVKTLKNKNNGCGKEIQKDVGEHQLSVGARHEEWQVLLGHEEDAQVTQTTPLCRRWYFIFIYNFYVYVSKFRKKKKKKKKKCQTCYKSLWLIPSP